MLREFDSKGKDARPSGITLVWCPFCFFRGDLRNFEEHYRQGKVSASMVCPSCHRRFYRSSLVTDSTTIAQYVRFVVEYPYWFRTINFEAWSRKLKELGMASQFWEEYRKLKPKPESQLDEKWD